MNNSIYDIVAKNVKQIFDEENISVIVTYETKLDRTSGIDSLNLLKFFFLYSKQNQQNQS